MEDERIVKLTGEPVSEQMKDVLERLSKGQGVSQDEIEATAEMKLARTNVTHAVDTSMLENREQLQYNVFRKMWGMGAATVDEAGKTQYNGDISLNKRLDIVIGLPASGKSSAIVDSLSEEFHSRVIDNDEAKKMIPQYNDGWGAGVVHKESQSISYSLFTKSVFSGENIVLPKVGSDSQKLINDYIALAKENGYQVNVHYVDLDRNKALGRMLNRFIEEGRFLDPNLIEKYAPLGRENHITQAYEELKENPLVDGYSMWDNDVERGERPILLEYENLTGNFIDNARTEREENNYGERENFAAVDGRDNGRSGRGNEQASDIRYGTSGGIKENVGGGLFQNNDERTEIMTDDFSQAYTQFLVETLGEDGERIAQNDLKERNPDLLKHRLNEMLDVIGGEDSSYITNDIQATVDRLNQQIDQFADAPTQNIVEQVQNLKDSFEKETGEDVTDWKIGQISNEELNSMLASGQTQELEFAINELREAGLSSGLDTLRLHTLDSIRRIEDDSPVRAEEISEPNMSEHILIDNKDCIKVDEWQTSMGTIVLGNDISDPTEDNFFLAQIGSVNAEFFGKPTREEVEDYFINELGQRELDMKEAGMNQEERKDSLSEMLKLNGHDVSQIETDSLTPMKQALIDFDNAYINANGSLSIQEINDCLMTNNLEKLQDSLVEFQDMDVRSNLSILAVETAEKIENMAYDGDLTLEEQRQIIITSLTEDKFSESMDSRLNYALDIYGAKDVADDIMLVTTVGATSLSHVEVAAENDGFKFRDDDSGLTYIFNGDDIAEVIRADIPFPDVELSAKNDPMKTSIFDNNNLTIPSLSGENGDGILLRYGNDKQGYDLAVWGDEDGKGQFAFADAGCLDAFLSESVDGDIIAMGQLPSQYENMNVLKAANLIAEECIGESFVDNSYQAMYLSDTISDVSIPTNDPVKLPVQAEFHVNDEAHTVYFMDEGAAERFTEKHLDNDHIGVDDVSVDIGVRSMTDSDLDKIMETVIDTHAYGTDDHGYVSFELDRENNKVTATKYDHDLTPVAQEKITFADKKDFAVETANFSPLTFMEKHTENPAFDGIKTLSWVDTEQFMFDVSEHEKSVRGAVEKFDSLEQQSGKYDVIFRGDDGKIVTLDSIDTIDDFSENLAPATGTFEVQEAGKLVVKGDIDDNMRDIIEEAISEDTDGISLDKEREALELDRPVSEQEIAHAVSEILYAHSDKDISLDEIEADILSQIEAAQGNPDRLDSIIDRLDNIYENDRPTLEESAKIYSCEERLNSLKDETQTREQDREIESREREQPAKAENSFQSVGDILKAGLPQEEADIEISKLLKAQGKADDFIQSVQLMSHCEPDIAMQMADASMIITQDEVQQKGFPQQNDLVTKQQNPLNKVEELEEGNYNQIDGIINNLPPKADKKPSLRESVEQKKEVVKERSQSEHEEKEQTTEKTTKKHTQELS